MRYWWVNQGRTWEDEFKGGYLWAPYFDQPKNSNRQPRAIWHWDTMDQLDEGDIIFSYVKGTIKAVSTVKHKSYRSEKPKSFKEWNIDGRKCDVAYRQLENPILISQHFNKISPMLPGKYSPLQKNGSGNQFYLLELKKELGEYLVNLIDRKLLFYSTSQIGQKEDVIQEVDLGSGKKKRKTITVEVTRVVRDTKLSKNIKSMYDYKCQICGLSIRTNTEVGKYAEAAHIKPLEKSGDDKQDNIICLCPNHHTMLDYGTISINDDYSLLGIEGEIHTKHRLNKQNLKFHRNNIFLGIKLRPPSFNLKESS